MAKRVGGRGRKGRTEHEEEKRESKRGGSEKESGREGASKRARDEGGGGGLVGLLKVATARTGRFRSRASPAQKERKLPQSARFSGEPLALERAVLT